MYESNKRARNAKGKENKSAMLECVRAERSNNSNKTTTKRHARERKESLVAWLPLVEERGTNVDGAIS